MNRSECLKKAKSCVCGGRETDYGEPENNFDVIAQLWSIYVEHQCYDEGYFGVDAQDVANMMILQKMGRIISGTATADSYADIAGYAACGCEIATAEEDAAAKEEERIFRNMRYRGYEGTLRYSKEDDLYIGEVLGTKDYLCYHGKSELDAKVRFRNCVDGYINQCLRLDTTKEEE